MDLSTCLAWKSRHVYLLNARGKAREGEIIYVRPAGLKPDDIDLSLRLTDGSVTVVAASEQGRSWNFAD
jgi:hypothetical protein